MRATQIEGWVLDIAAKVRAGQQIEDARVELKSAWPEVRKAARRLAGHANAAVGEPILWILGLDERRGPVPLEQGDTATWLAKLRAEFDGLAPDVVDVAVPVDHCVLVGLLFDTTRAPFVVLHPLRGEPGSGPVEREVPWREGTVIRSATRSDLIRLLVPLERRPDIELLELSITRTIAPPSLTIQPEEFNVLGRLYVVPSGDGPVVIPFHRTVGELRLAGGIAAQIDFLRMGPYSGDHLPGRQPPVELRPNNVLGSESEVVVSGPGQVRLSARARMTHRMPAGVLAVILWLRLRPVRMDRPIILEYDVPIDPPSAVDSFKWAIPRKFFDSAT